MTEISLEQQITEETSMAKKIMATENGEGPIRRLKTDGVNIYQVIVDELSQGTRNTTVQIDYISAYETALGVFRSTAKELRKAMDILTLEQRLSARQKAVADLMTIQAPQQNVTHEKNGEQDGLQREITDAVFFSNRYALYFAGQVGLELLKLKPTESVNLISLGTLDQVANNDAITQQLSRRAKEDLRNTITELKKSGKELNDDVLKTTLESIFNTWISQFKWSTFKDVATTRGIDGLKLNYSGYSLQNGDFKAKYSVIDIDSRFMPVTKKDVIGNREFVNLLWGNMLKLTTYDHDRRSNCYDPASVIFVYGGPGCGKTFTAHALIRSFAELCKSKGIPLKALTHSVTDYASHYQNLTAIQLAKLASDITDFPGPVIMYVADADTLFGSRKRGELTTEQQNTLNIYFKMFDGTLIPKNGKFMAIMDANYIDQIDDATKSRLFDELYELQRFDKADDFAAMARVSLQKRSDKLVLTEQDWTSIGEYILATPLSNREIDQVLKKIRRGFQVPEDMIGASYEEHSRYRAEQLRGLDKDKIITTFTDYIAKRVEIEEKSRRAKMESDVDRFLQYIIQKADQTEARIDAK